MELTSLLLPISDLSLDEPACTPELVENMVMADHDLSGGVISSLYPENSDAVEGTTPSSTKEPPSNALLKMTPDKETITTIIDLYSANKNKPQVSTIDLYSLTEEGTKPVKSEPEPCQEQVTSDSPREGFQPLPLIPLFHEPERVVVQDWFSWNDEVSKEKESSADEISSISDEEASYKEASSIWEDEENYTDEGLSVFLDEVPPSIYEKEDNLMDKGDETETIGMILTEQEEEATDLPDELQVAALEAR